MDTEFMVHAAQQELEHAEAKIERAMKNAFYEVGIELRHISDRALYKQVGYTTFDDYCERRWEWSRERAYQLIRVSTIVDNLSTKVELVDMLPTRETHVRPLLRLDRPQDQIDVWASIVENTGGNGVTAKAVEEAVARKLAELKKEWWSLDEWAALSADQKRAALSRKGDGSFNRPSDSIEWAWWSWNPVTGCKHGCPYCYALDIANRFFAQGFAPSFFPARLSDPQNTKVPQLSPDADPVDKIGSTNVFVCSMADLFGEWVPQEWIDAVLDTVRRSPQWNYLFLSKNPERMATIEWPVNAWVGTTVDRQARVARAEAAFAKVSAKVKFVSCEPMLEPIVFNEPEIFDWFIIGGQSKSTKCPEFHPEWAWVEAFLGQARSVNAMCYMKTNLQARCREYPGM